MTPKQFPGYSSPNYTPVPDQLFDDQLPDLSGAELKALMYIIRRTFGFKKESDNISLSQLLHGVMTRAGERLDRGTGLSRSTLIAALKGLVAKNLIIVEQRVSATKGNQATNYRLNVLYHPSSKIKPGESENRTSLVRKSDPQETVRQKRDIHLRNSKANAREYEDADSTGGIDMRQGDQNQSHSLALYRTTSRVSPGGSRFTAVADTLTRMRTKMQPQAASQTQAHLASLLPASAQLLASIAEISHELGDSGHLRANVTQAQHILAAWGYAEDVFVARLYEARAITQDRRSVRREYSESQPVTRPMAYFWTVVRDLLGLTDAISVAGTVQGASQEATRQGRGVERSNALPDE